MRCVSSVSDQVVGASTYVRSATSGVLTRCFIMFLPLSDIIEFSIRSITRQSQWCRVSSDGDGMDDHSIGNVGQTAKANERRSHENRSNRRNRTNRFEGREQADAARA